MAAKRKRHKPEFKAQVALEAYYFIPLKMIFLQNSPS